MAFFEEVCIENYNQRTKGFAKDRGGFMFGQKQINIEQLPCESRACGNIGVKGWNQKIFFIWLGAFVLISPSPMPNATWLHVALL